MGFATPGRLDALVPVIWKAELFPSCGVTVAASGMPRIIPAKTNAPRGFRLKEPAGTVTRRLCPKPVDVLMPIRVGRLTLDEDFRLRQRIV